MTEKDIKFVSLILEAPDSELDKSIKEKIKIGLDNNNINATFIKNILDECAFNSLATDFAMITLDILWRGLLKRENENMH